jgi:hypothetical protein
MVTALEGTIGADKSGTPAGSGTELTQPSSLDVPELRRHLKQRLKTSPILRPHLSNLEQMLKSWDAGGNRVHLAGNIERTIRAIETLRQPAA